MISVLTYKLVDIYTYVVIYDLVRYNLNELLLNTIILSTFTFNKLRKILLYFLCFVSTYYFFTAIRSKNGTPILNAASNFPTTIELYYKIIFYFLKI